MDTTDNYDFNLAPEDSGEVSLLREPPLSYGKNKDVSQLVDQLKKRTFALAVSIYNLLNSGPDSPALKVIRLQLLKAATSVGVNYRAVCRARSDKEFYSKLSIVVEETNETVYGIALLLKSNLIIVKE